MYEMQDPTLLEVLSRARELSKESVRLTILGELRIHKGKLCAFDEGEMFRALTLPEVVLLAAHDIVSSPFCIFAGNSDQARHLMRELRLHPKKAVILSHPSVFYKLNGMDKPVVINYGTYHERRDYHEFVSAIEARGASVYFVDDSDLKLLDDLREYLDAKGERDAS